MQSYCIANATWKYKIKNLEFFPFLYFKEISTKTNKNLKVNNLYYGWNNEK